MSVIGILSTKSSQQYTAQVIPSLIETTKIDERDLIVVIDNDGDLTLEDESPICILRNEAPRSFAANANSILRLARERNTDAFILNNDLILSPHWREELAKAGENTIAVPLSNREVSYSAVIINNNTKESVAQCSFTNPYHLDSYLKNPAQFAAAAEAHGRSFSGHWRVYCAPFFCVRIPAPIIEAVGAFDELFGRGGGEDYDYALRSRLFGFDVCFAVGSWVLHFGGKSSWDGPESKEEQRAREERFFAHFRSKWGDALFQYIQRENRSLAEALIPDLNEREQRGDFQALIRQLMGERTVSLKIPLNS